MAEQHPLSDEVIHDYGWYHYNSDQLRAAYDIGTEDRLEQVVKWIEANLLNPQGNCRQLYVYDSDLKTYKEFDYELIDRLTQAMRPTENN